MVRDYGLDYLIATVLLGGAIQVLFAVLGVAKLMRFIPRSPRNALRAPSRLPGFVWQASPMGSTRKRHWMRRERAEAWRRCFHLRRK